MILTVRERLQLLNVLPPSPTGKITALRIYRQFREALSFSEEEHKALELTTEGSNIRWNSAVPQGQDIEAGPVAIEWVAAILKGMEEADPPTLTEEYISLWDKFCTAA